MSTKKEVLLLQSVNRYCPVIPAGIRRPEGLRQEASPVRLMPGAMQWRIFVLFFIRR